MRFGRDNSIRWDDYTTECLRTDPTSNNTLPAELTTELHGAIGMVTEAGEILDIHKKNLFYGKEVDKINLVEELGDFMWYLAIWLHAKKQCDKGLGYFFDERYTRSGNVNFVFGSNNRTYPMRNIDKKFYHLVTSAAEILNDTTGHKCDWLTERLLLGRVITPIIAICSAFDISMSAVLEKNSNKLRSRSPDVFSEDKAINRDLTKERDILEGGSSCQSSTG